MEFKLGPHETLTQTSTDWDFDVDGDSKQLESAMIELMVSANGIGLAANQVGLTKRMFVIGGHNMKDMPAPFAVFNPVIKESSADLVLGEEGCLSYPNLFLKIKRPSWIEAEYQDSNGNYKTLRANGLFARCFQHEFDHLNGVCFVDKVSQMKLQLALKKLNKRKNII